MDDVDPRTACGTWETDERPSDIGRGMGGFGNVDQAGGSGPVRLPAKRDQIEGLVECEKRPDEAGDIAADAGRRRREGTAIDADAKQIYRISIRTGVI